MTPSTLSVPFRVSEILLVVSVILFFLFLSTIKSPPFSIFRVSIGIYVMIDGPTAIFKGDVLGINQVSRLWVNSCLMPELTTLCVPQSIHFAPIS